MTSDSFLLEDLGPPPEANRLVGLGDSRSMTNGGRRIRVSMDKWVRRARNRSERERVERDFERLAASQAHMTAPNRHALSILDVECASEGMNMHGFSMYMRINKGSRGLSVNPALNLHMPTKAQAANASTAMNIIGENSRRGRVRYSGECLKTPPEYGSIPFEKRYIPSWRLGHEVSADEELRKPGPSLVFWVVYASKMRVEMHRRSAARGVGFDNVRPI